MSLYDYKISLEISAQDFPFYGVLMAAMRQADSDNIERLKEAFPDTYEELFARYNAPGGFLTKQERDAHVLLNQKLPNALKTEGEIREDSGPMYPDVIVKMDAIIAGDRHLVRTLVKHGLIKAGHRDGLKGFSKGVKGIKDWDELLTVVKKYVVLE